jgi:small G protein signaling modulator 3
MQTLVERRFDLCQTLFRVWDVFLLDGLDVLFRIALGILRTSEQELLQCGSIPSVYVALENLPTRMWEGDKLLQVRSSVETPCFPDDTYFTRPVRRRTPPVAVT